MKELIMILAGTKGIDKVYLCDAEVDSVDVPARMCSVTVLTGKRSNVLPVRLMAAKADGLLLIPVLKSTVGIMFSDTVAPIIYQYSDIEKIIFRGGDLGGLIKIEDITAKLNKFVTETQAELTKIATGIATAGGTYTPGTIEHFTKTDYENTEITHG